MTPRQRSAARISRLVAAPVVRRAPVVAARPIGPVIPAELADDFLNGRLSQCCPACGRCEAAGHSCSWCGRPMGPDDWYQNKKGADERAARMPASPPADPPTEYRSAYRPDVGDGWPPAWGPNPYQKAPRPSRTRVNAAQTAEAVSAATPASDTGA